MTSIKVSESLLMAFQDLDDEARQSAGKYKHINGKFNKELHALFARQCFWCTSLLLSMVDVSMQVPLKLTDRWLAGQ